MLNKDQFLVKNGATKASLQDFIIPSAVIDFPRMKVVPPGYYYLEILEVHARVSSTGKKCLDVIYDLQGFYDSLGDHTIRLSYPIGSQCLQDLYKAMLNAGVPAGSTMKAAIGVTEQIQLVYDDEDSIGRIRRRVYDPPQNNTSSEEGNHATETNGEEAEDCE